MSLMFIHCTSEPKLCPSSCVVVMVDTACGNLRPNVISDVNPVLRLLDSHTVFTIQVIIG